MQYARTSQGIFCMNCHQTLLAKKKKAAALKASNSHSHSDSFGSNPSIPLKNTLSSSYLFPHQSTLPLNPSVTIPPPNFPIASPNIPVHSFNSKRSSVAFKEKSLPSLPTDDLQSPPLSLPLSQQPSPLTQSLSTFQPKSNNNVQLNRSNSYNTSSSIKSNSSGNGPNSISPPSRPSRQPAFDPALVRIPQRNPAPTSSRSGSISSTTEHFPGQIVNSANNKTGSNPTATSNGYAPIVSVSHSSPVASSSSSYTSSINSASSSTATTVATLTETKTENNGSQSTTSSYLNGVGRSLSGSNNDAPPHSPTSFQDQQSQPIDLKDSRGSNVSNGSSTSNSRRKTHSELVPSVPLNGIRSHSPNARAGVYVDNSSNSPVGDISLEESFLNELKSKDIMMTNTYTNISDSSSDSPDNIGRTIKSPELSSASTLRGQEFGEEFGMQLNGHYRSVSETRVPSSHSIKSDRQSTAAIAASASNNSATSYTSSAPSPTIRELYDSKARIAELEQQLSLRDHNRNMEANISEKRKTIAGLEAKGTVAKRELQLLAEAISRKDNLKDSRNDLIAAFTTDLSEVKRSLQAEIESLIFERDKLVDERDRLVVITNSLTKECVSLEDKKLQATYQVNQLHDMHIELAKQAMQKFGPMINKPLNSGSKEEFEYEPTPQVIDVSTDDKKERAHARRFWKRPTAAMAKGVKGFNKVFAQDSQQQAHFVTSGPYVDGNPLSITADDDTNNNGSTDSNDNITETATMASVTHLSNLSTNLSNDSRTTKPRNGWFNKSSATENMSTSNHQADGPVSLMGYDIELRVAYEHTNIPLIVTRCIQEVEKRGLTFEGIYRKSGGRSQVSSIEEAFEKQSAGDDPRIIDEAVSGDIAGVTSALKQYLRHLPNPLVSFETYDDFVEASRLIHTRPDTAVEMLRAVINTLPRAYKECLAVVCKHLYGVSKQSDVNLMTLKNLAVVFAPTLVRHTNGEREILDMAPRNDGTQLIIEKCHIIFADVVISQPQQQLGVPITDSNSNGNVQEDNISSSASSSSSTGSTNVGATTTTTTSSSISNNNLIKVVSNTTPATASNSTTNGAVSSSMPALTIGGLGNVGIGNLGLANAFASSNNSSRTNSGMSTSSANANGNNNGVDSTPASSSMHPPTGISISASQVGIANPI